MYAFEIPKNSDHFILTSLGLGGNISGEEWLEEKFGIHDDWRHQYTYVCNTGYPEYIAEVADEHPFGCLPAKKDIIALFDRDDVGTYNVFAQEQELTTEPEVKSQPAQQASTECSYNAGVRDAMCPTYPFRTVDAGRTYYYDFSDMIKENQIDSINVKLVDPSGKIIHDKTTSGHNRMSIEYPSTGMVGDYELIYTFLTRDGKGGWISGDKLRLIVPVVSGMTNQGQEQQSSTGCGEGTVMINGVCQLAKSARSTSMNIEPLYLIIGVAAIGGVIGAIAVAKRGSKTPKPAREEREEYESKYVARKPAKKKETSAFCENCGNSLKKTAKFCGSCGTSVP